MRGSLRALLALLVLVMLVGAGEPDAAPAADDAADLAEIEAALAEDADVDGDANADDESDFGDQHEAHHADHDHAEHHRETLDIESPEDAPTWGEFVDAWELFRDPIYAAGIAGLVLGFLSVFVVLRRMVFVSAALTQAAGFGVAASFYATARFGFTLDPVWGATGMALLTAALVAPDPRRIGLSREMVLGLAFTFFSAGAVLAAANIPQDAHAVTSILFGSAVAVSAEDMHRLAIAGGVVLLLQIWWFRGFAFASFDPLGARVQGLPVRLLDLVLLLSIGVMVGEASRTLGALPAFALSTLPGVAAIQLGRGPLIVTFAIAAVLGAAAGVVGYIASFFLELPVGATQTALAALLVLATLLLRAVIALAMRVLRRRNRV